MSGGQFREFTDEESNFASLLQRALDLEGGDRETLHQLVALLLHFMANLDLATQSDDRQTTKTQSHVLRHLNTLLGYNQQDKTFSVPPYKLRSLTVFHAFIGGISPVLDRNFEVGNNVLHVALAVLQYAPSPQRYASDHQPPDYSLCLLEPYTRNHWLNSLLIILYKYQYNSPTYSSIVEVLVKIVINTIDAQVHVCKENAEEPFEPPTAHSHRPRGSEKLDKNKDASTVSIGDIDTIQENDSPTLSPLNEAAPSSKGRPSPFYSKRTQPKLSETDLSDLTDRKFASPVIKKRNQRRQPGRPTFDLQGSAEEAGPHSPGEQVLAPCTVGDGEPREQLEMTVFSNRPSSRTGSVCETAVGSGGGEARRAGEPLLFVSHGGGDSVAGAGAVSPAAGGRAAAAAAAIATAATVGQSTNVELKMQEELRAFAESNGQQQQQQLLQRALTAAESEAAAAPATVAKPEKTISFSADLPPSAVAAATAAATAAAAAAMSAASGGGGSPGASDSGEAASQQSDEGPRRLDPRQVSLEALAADPDSAEAAGCYADSKPQFRQKKARKTGLSTIEMQKLISHREDTGRRRPRRADTLSKASASGQSGAGSAAGGGSGGGAGKKPSFKKVIEPFMLNRCQFCNAIVEQYDEDTISLSIVCLGAFVHREPVMAAPMLMSMFSAVSKIVLHSAYSWKADQPNVIAPGNMNSVAKQFLRCSFHQLAPNGLFVQLFQSKIEYEGFFKCMVTVLVDFQEMNCFRPLEMLLEALNERKSLPQGDALAQLMENVSAYLECLPTETAASTSWSALMERIDMFMRRLAPCLPVSSPLFTPECVFRMLHCLFRSPVVNNHKTVLEPIGRVLEFLLCNCVVSLASLVDLCSACNRVFPKERDRQHVTRTAIMLLVQALKFRCTLPDENFLLLVQLVLGDAGGCVEPSLLAESLGGQLPLGSQSLSTGAAELMRTSLNECVAFIADLHTVHKLKSLKTGVSLHEDTLGAHLKSAVSQYVVLEFAQSRVGEGGRQWAINKYLSWLRHPPATVQQGPREFLECLEHIRLLSWLLIGAMMHTAVTAASDSSDSGSLCQPIPLDASTYVAEHVMVIMTGYAEHSKGSTHGSVQQMSALNFAFHLCSLWTMYCETGIDDASPTNDARQRIMDFWGRVTPGILQLLSHAKGLADIVNGHLLHMMESLKACNSTILTKLIALWIPVFYAHTNHLNNSTQIRLQQTVNWEPPAPPSQDRSLADGMLLKWLKGYVLKLGLIESQSSQATQIYIT